MSVSERLRASCAAEWESLHRHPFVRGIATATLPPERFRFYLEQNLQYLPEYARAMALGASRAEDPSTMRVFASELANVVDVEIPENERLLRRVSELGARDLGGADGMAPATLGYTSFLVSTAAQHGPLEILAAILPCTWSYGEIGAALVGDVVGHPVYADWIRFFGSTDYSGVVATMRADFEERAEGADDAKLARLERLFAESVRFERAFWDMADRVAHWPDRRAPLS